jgi:SAM-dependent methyltransferase
MQLQVGNTWDDGFGRNYMELVNPNQAREIYEQQRHIWKTRNKDESEEFTEEFLQTLIAQQTPDYGEPSHAALKTFFDVLVAEKQPTADDPFSVVEIGAANGTTIRHFAKFFPDTPFDFFGMDALPELVADAQQNFPDHRVIAGTAEDFVAMDAADMGRDRFDVFMTSLVLCMMLPDLVYSVFKKAASMTDVILCRDYLTNKAGEISRNRPVLFEMMPDHPHLVFAAPFELMLRRLGFSRIEYIFEELADPRIRGMGTFLARRTHDPK